jgi:hypothetical protein
MGSKCCGDAEALPQSVFSFFGLLAAPPFAAALFWLGGALFLAAPGFFASVNVVFPVRG